MLKQKVRKLTILCVICVVVLITVFLIIPGPESTKWAPPTLTYKVDDAPTVPTYDPKEYETKPSTNAFYEPGYSFSLDENLQYAYAFEERGGLARLSLKNEGSNALFIYKVGVAGDWMAEERWYPKDVGFTVEPNEIQDLGLVTFGGPTTAGKHEIKFGVSILAKAEEGEWYDYGTSFSDPVTYEFEELAQEKKVEYKESEYRDFKVLNELVNPTAPRIREEAIKIASEYSGEYNVYQLCALFNWIRDEITYVSDPKGMDYWSPPDETLKAKGGDCEDHAILLASMIEAIGGSSRIILTKDHALASVYIGDENHADKVMDAMELFYGNTLPFVYWTEDENIWLVLESTGGFYPGDLPVGAKLTSEGWTFTDTDVVYFVDIVPEHF